MDSDLNDSEKLVLSEKLDVCSFGKFMVHLLLKDMCLEYNRRNYEQDNIKINE